MRLGQYLVPCRPNWPCIASWWQQQVPFEYVGTALFAFLLGGLGWIPLNRIPRCNRERAIDDVIDHDKIALDVLLKKAQDQAKTVSVSMSNGKVYVGWVSHLFNPAFPTPFIQILPIKSGYRDPITKEFHFTNFYSEALDKIERDFGDAFDELAQAQEELDVIMNADPKPKPIETEALEASIAVLEAELNEVSVEAEEFGIVLPVSEIHSVNIFSEYVYSKYFARPIAPLVDSGSHS